MEIKHIHHIAILCSDYQKSKSFYCDILGFALRSENYRKEKDSWKADLYLNNQYTIELFTFPNPPERITNPEALGLRHLAFAVADIEKAVLHLTNNGVKCEAIRVDPYTDKRFTFFQDPDKLPLELYEE